MTYLPQRYVRSGKIITAAGVSAGVDMALYLASLIAGDDTAKAIQLAVEYDPQPPFDSGNAVEASPELKERALQLLAAPWSPSAVPSSQVASAAFRDR